MGGKYKVIRDNTGFYALRYGERWRELTGDKMVSAMFYEILDLKQNRTEG